MLDFTDDLGIRLATGIAGPRTLVSSLNPEVNTEIGFRSLLGGPSDWSEKRENSEAMRIYNNFDKDINS